MQPSMLTGMPKSFEHVLANINKLNRSLEAVIAVSHVMSCHVMPGPAFFLEGFGPGDGVCLTVRQVGNEFSSVEALWSQFETVMAKEPEEGNGNGKSAEQGEGQGEGDQTKAEESE
jgi:hypothetical protein